MANKTCKKCKQSKPLTEYYKSTTYTWEKDGHDYYCKYCRVGTHLNSINNQDKKCSLNDCNKSHYAKDLCRMHYSRNVRNGHTNLLTKVIQNEKTYQYGDIKLVYKRNWFLMHHYKMTFDTFLERSANGCEICGNKPERNLHVDHDHKCCNGRKSCGKCVRGVICNRCNTAVDKLENGLMRADYPLYNKLQEYLEKYNG